jgi:hypothetical protein
VRDAVGERVGLAGAGAGDDEKRLRPALRRFALARVEPFEGCRGGHGRHYRLLLYILPVPQDVGPAIPIRLLERLRLLLANRFESC